MWEFSAVDVVCDCGWEDSVVSGHVGYGVHCGSFRFLGGNNPISVVAELGLVLSGWCVSNTVVGIFRICVFRL